MINLCNLPKPNIEFLCNIVSITNDTKECEKLIEQTFMTLYESRTGEKCTSIKKTDVHLLDFEEMKIVSDLIKIANDNNIDIAKQLTNLIIDKIQS